MKSEYHVSNLPAMLADPLLSKQDIKEQFIRKVRRIDPSRARRYDKDLERLGSTYFDAELQDIGAQCLYFLTKDPQYL
jgi:hypothetical protein